jgi:CBS domain-containing protein
VEVVEQPQPGPTEVQAAPETPAPAPAPATIPQPVQSVDAPVARESTGLLSVPVVTLMSTPPVWVSPDDSVLEVLRAMQQRDVGYALVGRNGALDGIVSRSNVLGAISPYLRPVFIKWRRPEDDATLNIKIKWAMSRPVQTIGIHTTLGQAVERMQQFGGRCLPVTGQDGKVVGILTVFDIFRALNPNKPAGRTPQAPSLMA